MSFQTILLFLQLFAYIGCLCHLFPTKWLPICCIDIKDEDIEVGDDQNVKWSLENSLLSDPVRIHCENTAIVKKD